MTADTPPVAGGAMQDPALADAIGSIRATHEDSWPRGPEFDDLPEAGSVDAALDPEADADLDRAASDSIAPNGATDADTATTTDTTDTGRSS